MLRTEPTPSRVSRCRDGPLHCVDRQWLVAIGEDRLEGPYASQEEAEDALARRRIQ